MAPLRVGFVREHFLTPLLQFQDADQNKTFTLVECPSGTGQLITRLNKDEIDVAIALTDPLISGIANGSEAYKLCGSYVQTPLNWAVITGKDTKFQSISDLKGTPIGISRLGSGSQTMAYVMALQQGWPTEDLRFQSMSSHLFRDEQPLTLHTVNNDIHGLINSVNDGSTSAFMWEWFTTKPWVDRGEARFIGSVPTPWPSWLIAAHPSPERAPPEALTAFMTKLSEYVRAFDSAENRAGPNVEVIKAKFGYPEEDIKAWLKTVAYPPSCLEIPSHVITDTLSVLEKAGVVKAPQGGFVIGDFVHTEAVKLT